MGPKVQREYKDPKVLQALKALLALRETPAQEEYQGKKAPLVLRVLTGPMALKAPPDPQVKKGCIHSAFLKHMKVLQGYLEKMA